MVLRHTLMVMSEAAINEIVIPDGFGTPIESLTNPTDGSSTAPKPIKSSELNVCSALLPLEGFHD